MALRFILNFVSAQYLVNESMKFDQILHTLHVKLFLRICFMHGVLSKLGLLLFHCCHFYILVNMATKS